MSSEIRSLEQLLDRIRSIDGDHDPVSMKLILNSIGRRSFGPIMLLTGLIILAPLVGDIPGVPTLMGLIILLTASQLLVRRDSIWMPAFIVDRSVSRERMSRILDRLEKPSRIIDKLFYARLEFITGREGVVVIGIACVIIALILPLLEFIPFSANLAGIALTMFGLALIARDGYLALFALACTAGSIWIVIATILGS
jgi:hypothetical protein